MEHERRSEKTKAGIITLYHGNYNFGGLLQAYALPRVLSECFGVEAEQIAYKPDFQNRTNEQPNSSRKQLFSYTYQAVYSFFVLFFSKTSEKHRNQRKEAFDYFIHSIPHSKSVYEFNTIHECISQYQIFFCGGDQIWNDYQENRNIMIYTLQFVPPGVKKIAYAPSMAILETTPNFKRIMSNGLNQLDFVSVREKKAEAILKSFTNKKISIVVDPVLLITEDEWKSVSRATKKKEKYILCYLLGDSIEYRKAVRKLAHKLHLPIMTFPHILYNVVRKCDLFFGDIHDYTSGPLEFLGLIQNAEMVITDSFHACIFSMIFQKPFLVFERDKSNEKGNMNSRIYDFLEEYHLERQLVTEEELTIMSEIPKVDFTYAQEHWKKRRLESLTYLEHVLKK